MSYYNRIVYYFNNVPSVLTKQNKDQMTMDGIKDKMKENLYEKKKKQYS